MEIESIAVICLITLVVLIIQIIVTFRLLLYFHYRAHEKDEEYALRTRPTALETVSAREDARSPSRKDAEVHTVPRPVYPASSRYSVRTDTSDASSRYDAYAPSPWHGAETSAQKRESHSDFGTEYGNPFADDALSKAKKKDILEEVWSKKP